MDLKRTWIQCINFKKNTKIVCDNTPVSQSSPNDTVKFTEEETFKGFIEKVKTLRITGVRML